MSTVEFRIVTDEEVDIRLDRWFRRKFPSLGHGQLQKLLRTGQIRVDSKRAKGNQRLVVGQKIRIPPNVDIIEEETAKRPSIPFSDIAYIRSLVIYRDEWVVALNKPPGLAVQGGSRTTRHLDAMLEGLQGSCQERLRLVHRLDKDTSGVLLLAATATSAARLGAAFRSRAVTKLYWGITVGIPTPPNGQIVIPLVKEQGRGGERIVTTATGGKRSVTHYRVIETVGEGLAFVVLMPTTGRTHQLRVHMSAINAPILGDGKYGGKAAFIDALKIQQCLHLHARRIVIPHPSGNGTLSISAEPPRHMAETFGLLSLDTADADNFFNLSC